MFSVPLAPPSPSQIDFIHAHTVRERERAMYMHQPQIKHDLFTILVLDFHDSFASNGGGIPDTRERSWLLNHIPGIPSTENASRAFQNDTVEGMQTQPSGSGKRILSVVVQLESNDLISHH